MENDIKLNSQELQIQGLIGRYLATRNTTSPSANGHIDEDSLSAFVEGTLNARESDSIVSHLVDCGSCRHETAELIRLDLAFAEEETSAIADTSVQPARISEVLSGLFSKIFGSTEGAVFAHEEKAENEEDAEETKEEETK
jgi:hypothetical protein